MFQCDRYKCIPPYMACDGIAQCSDSKDEIDHCGNFLLYTLGVAATKIGHDMAVGFVTTLVVVIQEL